MSHLVDKKSTGIAIVLYSEKMFYIMQFKFNRDFKKMLDFGYTNAFSILGYEGLEDLIFPKKDDPSFEYSEEKVETETSATIKETWKSNGGSTVFSRTTSSPKKKKVSLDEIKEKIKKAVEAEDYETAAKLKRELEKEKRKD